MASFLSKEGLDYFYQKLNSKFSTIATAVDLSSKIELKADKTAVKEQIANLVNSAPETLDTLNELAAALGDDPNFATTIATEIGKKVNSSEYNDAIAGINTSIASITPEKIGALNKEEYLGPVVLEGNPIVYESGTEGLGIAAVSYLEPKQAGSGDPYPAGGGKNIFPEWKESTHTVNGITFEKQADGSIRAHGSPTAYANIQLTEYKTLKEHGFTEEMYVFSGLPEASDAWFVDLIGDANTANINFYKNGTFDLSDKVTESGTYAWRIVITPNVGSVDLTFKPQVEKGSTPTEYAPYSNIRPIVGYDKLNLNHAGKNLCPTGSIELVHWAVPNSDILNILNFLPAGTYTFSAKWKLTHTVTDVGTMAPTDLYGISFYCGNDNLARTQYEWGTTSIGAVIENSWSFTVKDEHVGKFTHAYLYGVGNNQIGATGYATIYDVQIEAGSATSYTPYKGNTHTIQIGKTIYGGKIDWLTGKLNKNVGNITLDGSQGVVSNWFGNHGNMIVAYSVPDALTISPTVKSNLLISDKLKTEIGDDQHLFEQNTNSISMSGSSGCIVVCIRGITTLEGVHAWLSQNPVECVYPLADPVEIQLTPTQISELEGINTLYGNGSNIRAIFNTTGSASPILESISGILPVEKGGTGSTSAAEARNNLGITPQNIGALPTTGGDVTGRLVVNGGENYVDLSVIRKINGSEHTACLLPNSNTGCTELFYVKDGTTICNYLSLKETYTAFMKPVDIASGGTGAADAATARANLGITPANIGALSRNGGDVNGTLRVVRNDTNVAYNDLARTLNGSLYEAGFTVNNEGKLLFRFNKDGTSVNMMVLEANATGFGVPVNIASGGTGANNRHGALTNLCAFGAYTRGDMGNSPNFDNPGMNGLFEVRSIAETPNATGTRPFDGFGPMLSFRTPDHIAMLQIGGTINGLKWRAKQDSEVTLAGVAWRDFLDSSNYTDYTVTKTGTGASGNWEINVTGNAATASAFNSARSIELSGAVYGIVSSNGASGWSINTTIAEKTTTPTNFASTFRAQTKGDTANGAYLSVIRSDSEDSWGYMPIYGTGIAFGRWDTHTYLYTDYHNPVAYIGGGAGTSLDWVRRIAFTDGLGAYGTWGISITGSSASCTGNAATATKATQDGNGANIASTYLKISGGGMSGRLTLNTDVTDHTTPMTQILCINCSDIPSGTTLTDKNAPGIGFHIRNNSWGSLILNSGAFKFINDDATGFMPVYASSFVGSGASLTSLNASNISSGTLILERGGTGATSKDGARTNLGITSGTALPSYASEGDLFLLRSTEDAAVSGTTYSTSETLTGNTWVDGKPIYRYILITTTTLKGGAAVIGTLPSTHETMVKLQGVMISLSDNSARPIPYAYYGNANWTTCYYVSNDRSINLQMGSGYSGTQKVIIIFEYTKP